MLMGWYDMSFTHIHDVSVIVNELYLFIGLIYEHISSSDILIIWLYIPTCHVPVHPLLSTIKSSQEPPPPETGVVVNKISSVASSVPSGVPVGPSGVPVGPSVAVVEEISGPSLPKPP